MPCERCRCCCPPLLPLGGSPLRHDLDFGSWHCAPSSGAPHDDAEVFRSGVRALDRKPDGGRLGTGDESIAHHAPSTLCCRHAFMPVTLITQMVTTAKGTTLCIRSLTPELMYRGLHHDRPGEDRCPFVGLPGFHTTSPCLHQNWSLALASLHRSRTR